MFMVVFMYFKSLSDFTLQDQKEPMLALTENLKITNFNSLTWNRKMSGYSLVPSVAHLGLHICLPLIPLPRQTPQRGRQITACRDWRSKNETDPSSLGEVYFFESHIRATNAPALRNLNFFNYVKKLCLLAGALSC